MNRIKVIHITQSSGGVKTFLDSFMTYSDKTRFHYTIVAPNDSDIIQSPCVWADHMIAFSMQREIGIIGDMHAAFRMIRLLNGGHYDVIHCHSSKAGLIGRLAAFVLGRRNVVFSPHGLSFFLFSGYLRQLALVWECIAGKVMTRYLLTTSQSEHDRAAKDLLLSTTQIRLVVNGVDIRKIDMLGIHRGENVQNVRLRVLMTARLLAIKNPLMFMHVAEMVLNRNEKTEFILIGAGFHDEYSSEISEHMRSSGRADRFTIVPWLSWEHVQKAIQEADVYVSTSYSESFGYAVVEAMVHGKPVVATDIDGSRDIVIDGVTGFLVSVNDVESMAEKIILLLESEQLRSSFGKAGRIRAEQQFDAAKNIHALEEVYLSMVKEPNGNS